MFTTIAVKRVAFVLLLASAVAGTAQAQTLPPDVIRSCKISGGLFTITGGTASFHLVLDDHSAEPPVFVVMQFINNNGTVVKSRTTSIGAGGSATLEHRGTGLFRAQADIYELRGLILTKARTVEPSLEIVKDDSTIAYVPSFRKRHVGPDTWAWPCDILQTQ